MDRMVVVANEPVAYRTAIAGALPHLRPGIAVHQVDPAALETVVLDWRPLLVICSALSEAVRRAATAVPVFYPRPRTTRCSTSPDIGGVWTIPNSPISWRWSTRRRTQADADAAEERVLRQVRLRMPSEHVAP